MTSNSCIIDHTPEVEKLAGQWVLRFKVNSKNGLKFFFEQGNFILPLVSTTDCWYFDILKDLKAGDQVKMNGWRTQTYTDLNAIEYIYPESEDVIECDCNKSHANTI